MFLQNGSMTDASSLGSMTTAPAKLKKAHNGSWSLWEKLADGRPSFGRPAVFNSCVAQSDWASFTVTLSNSVFFEQMQRFSGNEAGTGGLVTFKDSNWLMSIVLAHQPHFANQPADVQVFWGYGLFPDRIGNFVPKAMADCTGAELLQELCLTSPACSCLARPETARCRCRQTRRTSPSSASSSRSRWIPSSRSNFRCGPRRWRSTSCSASRSRFHP